MNLLELLLLSSSICIVGLLCCIYNLFWATIDYRALDQVETDRSGRTVIIGRALQEVTRLVGLVIFLGINVDVFQEALNENRLINEVMWERTTVLLLALEIFLFVNSAIGTAVNLILNKRRRGGGVLDREGEST